MSFATCSDDDLQIPLLGDDARELALESADIRASLLEDLRERPVLATNGWRRQDGARADRKKPFQDTHGVTWPPRRDTPAAP